MKTAWYWYRDRHVDQWNRIEDPEKNTHRHLIFDKYAKNIQWKKDSLFNKWCWANWKSVCREIKIDPYLPPCTKVKSKWIKDLNIKPDIINLIEERVGKSIELIGTGGTFLNRISMPHALRSKTDKWNLIKLESFHKTNWQPTDWEKKIFTNPTSDRSLISKIYNELKKLITNKQKQTNKKAKTNLKMGY